MKLYDCRVRLAGLVHHEVPKYAATEKEIILLRTIHGADSVVGIKNAGESKRTDTEELNRLSGLYGVDIVEATFSVKLGDMSIIVEDDEDEVVIAQPEKQVRRKRNQEEQSETVTQQSPSLAETVSNQD